MHVVSHVEQCKYLRQSCLTKAEETNKGQKKIKYIFLSLPTFRTYLRVFHAPEMTRGVVDNLFEK